MSEHDLPHNPPSKGEHPDFLRSDAASDSQEQSPDASRDQICALCRETSPSSCSRCIHCGYNLNTALRSEEAAKLRSPHLGKTTQPDAPGPWDWFCYALLAAPCPVLFAASFESEELALVAVVILLTGFVLWVAALSNSKHTRAQGYLLAAIVGFGSFLVSVIGLYANT